MGEDSCPMNRPCCSGPPPDSCQQQALELAEGNTLGRDPGPDRSGRRLLLRPPPAALDRVWGRFVRRDRVSADGFSRTGHQGVLPARAFVPAGQLTTALRELGALHLPAAVLGLGPRGG